MKYLFTLLYLIMTLWGSNAQTLEEWVQQKETGKKYLLEQIAALKIYNEDVAKGFAIAKKGLTLISTIKRGDFKLHEDYFTSLKMVNPQIKKDVRIGAILTLQLQMLQAYKTTYHRLKQSKQISSHEINYYSTVGTNLMEQCIANLNELLLVITDDNFQMKDDERLISIENLYKDIVDKNAFLQHFNTSFQELVLQKAKEEKEAQLSKSIYGTN